MRIIFIQFRQTMFFPQLVFKERSSEYPYVCIPRMFKIDNGLEKQSQKWPVATAWQRPGRSSVMVERLSSLWSGGFGLVRLQLLPPLHLHGAVHDPVGGYGFQPLYLHNHYLFPATGEVQGQIHTHAWSLLSYERGQDQVLRSHSMALRGRRRHGT